MKTPRWICAKCRQPFTRRWNAYRHSNNKHFGSIKDIISFTEYTTNGIDSSIPLNGFYEHKNNSHHPTNVKKQLFFDKPISFNNNHFDTFSEPIDDALERESSSYELLDQLAPKYEEMHRTLDFVPEPSRSIILGNALSSAINSDNPKESMHNQLIDLRKNKTRVMMLKSLTAFNHTGKEFTKEFLKLLLKQKEYSHLRNKINEKDIVI
jgi:hypothetical protein